MASIAKTAFEVLNPHGDKNVLAGKFKVGTAGSYTDDICPSGFLCVPDTLLANDGYQGLGASNADILNGNAWNFVKAADGKSGNPGDHTGIFAFDSYDVRKVTGGDNVWNLGANFLGLELPANTKGDFCEIILGEQYCFGEGDFTTLPADATAVYVTIANGLLVASATAPAAASGVYFKWLRKKGFTVGARSAGFEGYVLKAFRI